MVAAKTMNPISLNLPCSNILPQINCKKTIINGMCGKGKKCKEKQRSFANKNQAEDVMNTRRKTLSQSTSNKTNKHINKVISQAKRINCKQGMEQRCEAIKACKKLPRCKSITSTTTTVISNKKQNRNKVIVPIITSQSVISSCAVQASLPKKKKNNFERLMLSLQSPLPNEHQFTLNTLTLISSMSEDMGKELNILEKVPALLNMLLAHTGVYHDCGLRKLVEEIYREGFAEGESLDFAAFWGEFSGCNAADDLQQQLLCERFPGEQLVADELSETQKRVLYGVMMGSAAATNNKCSDTTYHNTKVHLKMMTSPTLSMERIGTRIQQVGQILRNLSFDSGNASVMAMSTTLLRFLLMAAETEYGSLMVIAFDIVSNIAKYCVTSTTGPEDGNRDVLSHMHSIMTNFVTYTFHCSNDRFKILRCLEAIQGLAMSSSSLEEHDRKFQLIKNFKDQQFFAKLFQLLTLKEDTILVIACLDCLLATTTVIGEQVCDDIIQTVHGSLGLLISYITVDLMDDFGTTMADASTSQVFRTELALDRRKNNITPPIAPGDRDDDDGRDDIDDERGAKNKSSANNVLVGQEQEHVITKSTRLTAALVLRNFAKHSDAARRSLKQYETHLANVSMNRYDCSAIIAHVLHHLAQGDSI